MPLAPSFQSKPKVCHFNAISPLRFFVHTISAGLELSEDLDPVLSGSSVQVYCCYLQTYLQAAVLLWLSLVPIQGGVFQVYRQVEWRIQTDTEFI